VNNTALVELPADLHDVDIYSVFGSRSCCHLPVIFYRVSLTLPFGDVLICGINLSTGVVVVVGAAAAAAVAVVVVVVFLFYVTTAVCHIPPLLLCECSRLDEWAALLL
jgi:hypothetical protein